MESHHLVCRGDQANFVLPDAYKGISSGFGRWSVVNRASGSVHQEFSICQLDPGGRVGAHLHTFEESVYVLEGELLCETGDGRFVLREGDYGVFLVAAPHALRNNESSRVRWIDMLAPQPR